MASDWSETADNLTVVTYKSEQVLRFTFPSFPAVYWDIC